MDKFHKEILDQVKKASQHSRGSKHNASYHGSSSTYYNLVSAEKKGIAKQFVQSHLDLSYKQFVELLNLPCKTLNV